MFGRFKKKPQPSPEVVVDTALAALRDISPNLAVERDGMALRIRHEDRLLVWNLTDVARLAPTDPEWREGIASQARQVLGVRSTPAHLGLGARLRPAARVPEELRTGDRAAEPFAGDLWALYGHVTSDGLSVGTWSELVHSDRASMRTVHAALTLGRDFTPRQMLDTIDERIPVFTNGEPHPQVATALLMPMEWWTMILDAFGPATTSLLAAVPSPGRIFLAAVDEPAMVDVLSGLIASAHEIEEDLLSTTVFRFDGTAWSAAT
jgi:hypothetical protein